MTKRGAVEGFKPSQHGFHFTNWFHSQPAIWLGTSMLGIGIGDAKNGLCGGFCLGTRARFERGEAPPPDRQSPNRGQPLFAELVRRQVDSFELGVVPWRFLKLAAFSSDRGRAGATAADAWPKIRADIDAGRLSMVGLVRSSDKSAGLLGVHHQVLAYAYELDPDEARILVYDPNHPDRDDVTLTVRLLRPGPDAEAEGVELAQSTGEPLVALLRAS
jgi:hypothetical protein